MLAPIEQKRHAWVMIQWIPMRWPRKGVRHSGEAAAVWDGAFDGGDDDAVFSRETGQQELRAQRANLLLREVDHADDLATDKIVGRIQRGDLGAGPALAIRAEINPDLVGRLVRLGKCLDPRDRAGNHVHALEFTPAQQRVVHVIGWEKEWHYRGRPAASQD